MRYLMITNNDKVHGKYSTTMEVVYVEKSAYLDILYQVRDYVHRGYKILTHPMAGSLKPNQTPFKSVLLEKNRDTDNYQSIMLIESSIEAAQKFMQFKATPVWSPRIREDFKTVDLSLMDSAVNNPMISRI